MDKFKYRVYDYKIKGGNPNWYEVEAELDRLGLKGWELVSTTPSWGLSSGGYKNLYGYIYTLKRKVGESDEIDIY